jgi:hypothetical protein
MARCIEHRRAVDLEIGLLPSRQIEAASLANASVLTGWPGFINDGEGVTAYEDGMGWIRAIPTIAFLRSLFPNVFGILLLDQAASFSPVAGSTSVAVGGIYATSSVKTADHPILSNRDHQSIVENIIPKFVDQIKLKQLIFLAGN